MQEKEHVFDLLPAYALGSLEEEEKTIVQEHLAGCDICQAELWTYQSVTDQLGFAAPDATPSPAVKERLMQGIHKKPLPESERHSRRGLFGGLRSLSLGWGIIGLFLIAALLVSNVILWRQVSNLQARQNNFQTISMTGTGPAPDATGLIIISPDGKHGTLVVDDLPPLAPDKQYQLWLIKDGKRTSGGVFSAGEDGYAGLWVKSPLPLIDYTSFGVTIEPKGGSSGPTGAKVLGNKS
jgi:anti-sigma-K factor RskA